VTFIEGLFDVSVSVAGVAALVVGAAELGVVVGTRGALDVLGADGAVVVGRTVVDGTGVVGFAVGGLDGAAGVGVGAVAVGVAGSAVCGAI
jgi:hypothetical protein